MRMIDAHFHIVVIPHEWQHIPGLCELDTVIVPSDQMVPDFSVLDMVKDHYDRILTEKSENAHDFGIFNVFLTIPFLMWGLPLTQLDNGVKLMEEYISKPRVVGVGEAGWIPSPWIMRKWSSRKWWLLPRDVMCPSLFIHRRLAIHLTWAARRVTTTNGK
jgi:hypothetical protein